MTPYQKINGDNPVDRLLAAGDAFAEGLKETKTPADVTPLAVFCANAEKDSQLRNPAMLADGLKGMFAIWLGFFTCPFSQEEGWSKWNAAYAAIQADREEIRTA